MPIFKLTQETVSRLREKFEEFQRQREAVEDLLAEYVADYSRFDGTTLARQEYLEEKYSSRVPPLSHLTWNEDGEIYWNVPDIAIVLGRQRPSITRAFARMEREDGWCARLLALRKEAKSTNGLPVYVYHRDIFNLLIDRYEEEYLRRFAAPRRGDKRKAPNIKEVRRFWDYLKANAQIQDEHIVRQEEFNEEKDREELSELPVLPPMRWKDVISLIWRKAFTIRTGMFFSILFAVSFELVRRCPRLLPWTVGASAMTLATCAALLHFRRGKPGILGGLGAGSLLFTVLWGAGLLSPDGIMPTPGGMFVTPTGQWQGENPDSLSFTSPEYFLRWFEEPWVTVRSSFYRDEDGNHVPSSLDGLAYVNLNPGFLFSPASDAVSAIVYGINTEQPDTVLSKDAMSVMKDDAKTDILFVKDGSIKYVTSRLILKDGTSSEVRRCDLVLKPVRYIVAY
ncbi:MAG: hypothetical protein K6E38_09310 [Fretibacterium sp.]|nr:hypothetical protein [Fretibacterium sp.]